MSEAKIVALMFVSALAIGGVAGVVLSVTDAGGTAYGLTLFCGAALGGYLSSVVLSHCAKRQRRQEREQIILSR